jgi:4-hydroxythreonine-4-phosphate dehydrogenase
MDTRPIIGITMGDPVGIGPEIALKALSRKTLYDICRPLVLGDKRALKGLNDMLELHLALHSVNGPEEGRYEVGVVDIAELSHLPANQLHSGRPSAETGSAMVQYITTGIDWALERKIHGLVTCPINKAAMAAAGFAFPGHTELLAKRTSTSDYVMMLAGNKLRVALVTIHVPLANVSKLLTEDAIMKALGITERALRELFGIPEPRLAVAALNPHCGEAGLFGDEEVSIIGPAIDKAKALGLQVSGPHPADTLFYWALKGRWDAVLAMYHDQGLIPFKMVHFTDGVNTTLGLPIIRTSVDHGTAYDIAGQGKADPGSLAAAIGMATQQAQFKQKLQS